MSSGCVKSISVLVFMRLHYNRIHGVMFYSYGIHCSLLINHVLTHLSVLNVKIALGLVISSVAQ